MGTIDEAPSPPPPPPPPTTTPAPPAPESTLSLAQPPSDESKRQVCSGRETNDVQLERTDDPSMPEELEHASPAQAKSPIAPPLINTQVPPEAVELQSPPAPDAEEQPVPETTIDLALLARDSAGSEEPMASVQATQQEENPPYGPSGEDAAGHDSGNKAAGAETDGESSLARASELMETVKLKAILYRAFISPRQIVARGVTVDRDNCFTFFDCARRLNSTPSLRRGRASGSGSGSGSGTQSKLKYRPIEESIWTLSCWQKLDETSSKPPSTFEQWLPQQVVIPGLSVGKTPFALNENDRNYFDAVGMHTSTGMIIYASAASPGLGVAFRGDLLATLTDVERPKVVRALLDSFALAVKGEQAQEQEQEEPRKSKKAKIVPNKPHSQPLDHDHDLDHDDNVVEPALFDASQSHGLSRRASNFTLLGRAMAFDPKADECRIFYLRAVRAPSGTTTTTTTTTAKSTEWVSEGNINPNVSQAFQLWAFHRTGTKMVHANLACGIATMYLRPRPDVDVKPKIDNDDSNEYEKIELEIHRLVHGDRGEDLSQCPILSVSSASALGREKQPAPRPLISQSLEDDSSSPSSSDEDE